MSDAATVYFAYGSNLHPPQMADRCADCTVLQPAELADFHLSFRGRSRRWGGGVGTIVAAPGARTPGLLYRLSAADVRALDGFEGYPTVYDRIAVCVQARDGTELAAMTYQRIGGNPVPPSMRYFHQIWISYKAFGLDEQHLVEAVEETLAEAAPPK